MNITKPVGLKARQKEQLKKREEMEAYFDSLQDQKYEVIESRILQPNEIATMSYISVWNGARYNIRLL